MSRLINLLFVLTTLVLLNFNGSGASAATLIIGSNNDLSRYPFGLDPAAASSTFPDFAAGGTYQEVYAGSAFSGPVTITQIALASKGQLTSGPGIASFNFNLALSTTAAGPGGLSTNLAANRGADFVQVFTGALTTSITANNQFDLVIDIVPFTYNPANGNLLLDVTFNSPTQFTGGQALYYNAGFSSNTSRAANPSGNVGGAFTDGFALQTRFTTRANAQVTLGNLAQTFDGTPKSVSVTTDPSDLEVSLTYDGSATPPTNAGSYAVAAVVSDPNFIGQTVGSLTISKADQQIAFGPLPNKTLADADFGVNATASSNLAVSLTASGNCTVTGAQVHLTGAGACTITATQDGNANNNPAATVARTFSIGKADQQITFDALANKKLGDADFGVNATASSNLAVSFSADGNCTVAVALVHLTATDTCTITASQDGNANFNAAAPVARTFSIEKADQQITFDALADRKFGEGDFDLNATSTSNLIVSFAAIGSCEVTSHRGHLIGAGQCTITASQNGDATTNPAPPVARTFSIAKADQQITFDALADRKFGDADFNIFAMSTSNLIVNYAASGNCTVTARQVHLTGGGQCTITASHDGDANFNPAAPVARTFSVSKADQQISFEALADKTFGDADFNISATSSSNLAVSFSANENCMVNGVQVHLTGAGACTITATQDGDANTNAAAPVARTFSIGKADQQITFDALADKKVGEADFGVNAMASSNRAVSFAASGNCTVTGTQVHLTGAGACTITASQDGNSDFNQAAAVSRTFTIADQADNQTLISFGAPAFEVAESVGFVRITVKRSGATSGSSTVDYATDDTGASPDCARFNDRAASRCNFNAAIGTLKFAPGEIEKSFNVLINRDSRVEVPAQTFTVNLSAPGGATLSTPATATVQIDDASGGLPPNINVIDDTRTFVRQQYHDFLNREPDLAGLAFWADNIDKCADPARRPADLTVAQCKQAMRVNTSAAFFLSIEFQQTGNLVRSVYVASLDRPLMNNMPAFAEFTRDSEAMQLGVVVGEGDWQQTLNDNRDAFIKDFVMRAEFVGLYPITDTPAQYVDKLYLHAGITPPASERSDAIAEFGSATSATDTAARGRALLRVIQNNSFQEREVNRSFVQMQYLGYLRRDPNDLPDSSFDGYDFWLQKLDRFNGNFIDAEMVKAFIESSEYRARFGP